MVKQVHICDLCNTECESKDLAHFEVKAVGSLVFPSTKNHYLRNKVLCIDICRGCLEKKGFAIGPDMDDMEKENHNEKVLEDKLLDILSDLGISPQD